MKQKLVSECNHLRIKLKSMLKKTYPKNFLVLARCTECDTNLIISQDYISDPIGDVQIGTLYHKNSVIRKYQRR